MKIITMMKNSIKPIYSLILFLNVKSSKFNPVKENVKIKIPQKSNKLLFAFNNFIIYSNF